MTIAKDYFKTIGTGIMNTFANNNKFNYDMFCYCNKYGCLVDVVGNMPKERFRVKPLKEIKIKDDKNQAKPNQKSSEYKDVNLFTALTKSTQEEIQQIGLTLSNDFYKQNGRFLAGVYLLTSLCVVLVESRDKTGYSSFLATKNDVVIDMLVKTGKMCENEAAKISRYKEKLTLTDDEVNGYKLNVIKLTQAPTGNTLKIGAGTVYPKSKKTTILPYYMLRCFSNNLMKLLSHSNVKIEYFDGKGIKEYYTTLGNPKLYNIAQRAALYDPSKLVVYDMGTQTEETLNVINIVNISKV